MNNKKKLYQILSVLISVLFIYFAWDRILPEYTNLSKLLWNYAMVSDNSDNEHKERVIRLKQEIKRLQHAVKQINAELPTEREFSKATTMLDSLEQKTGLDIDKIKTLATDSTAEYKLINTDLEVTGKFDDLKQFITDIENSPRPITLRKLSINLPKLNRRTVKSSIGLEIICQKD